ncbi:uncharacterized protein MKK02DRAFT_29366 [Dioszegia hungarica]|uniref:Uncharacterized protein n=1 Tax=Dioszegia hungarica TaxID=4972 RepID=A0AA38HGQ3_9TREE|nr:uncharacterized protein MKK02DRAFT_29366 [Dioszegia hungarica]KAI9639266.1 hypothetical protein MKK02DRAFT_29366 [Dioszegia hungarica]
MPALQRTPPQRVGRSPAKPYAAVPKPASPAPESNTTPTRARAPIARPDEGHAAALPPTSPFVPRVQKVMRTPPGGSALSSSSMGPPPVPLIFPPRETPITAPDVDMAEVRNDTDMFVEEQIAAGTSTAPRRSIYPAIPPSVDVPSTHLAAAEVPASTTPTISPQPRRSTTLIHSPPKPAPIIPSTTEAGPSTQPSIAAAATPAPRTPRSRRTAIAAPMEDPVPLMEVEEASQWGKRYSITLDTLQLAIKNAAGKWTRRDLEGIFPLLAAKFPQELRQIHADASTSMQKRIGSEAKILFEHYKVGRAMQMLDGVVRDAQEYGAESKDVRLDAWRPDLSPEALTAAANLGLYDEAYDRLKTEYLALHADCSTRFSSIQAKQAQLAELESSVSESVTELDQTLQALNGFPTGEMKDWAETTMGRLEGGRVVEKA